jgi:multiple sugar transport system ATP-binding protein
VTDLPPKDRDIAMVFQNYALHPHLTLSENLSFPLEIARLPKEQIRHRVHEVASILDIEQFLDRKPRALSGGQPQRVAMCRAIVRSPHVFLMDEPLSDLDAKLRTQTRTQIAALQRRQGHDRLRDPRPGRSHDDGRPGGAAPRRRASAGGTPQELYEQPDNVFVAGFMSSPAMNLLELPLTDGGVLFGDLVYPIERDAPTRRLRLRPGRRHRRRRQPGARPSRRRRRQRAAHLSHQRQPPPP